MDFVIGLPQSFSKNDAIWVIVDRLMNLEYIVADGNLLKGSLPDSIANLSTHISYISIEGNQFHGRIPSGIGNLLNLTVFDIVNSYLTSPISTDIGKLSKLQGLYLQGNKFTGLPPSLGNLTSLNILSLGQNTIHGSLPPNLGNCRNLLELNLSHNNLCGSIPPETMNLSSISKSYSLAHNSLTDSIPSEVGNSFEGQIPQSLRELRGLRELDLSCNNLSGLIPSYLELNLPPCPSTKSKDIKLSYKMKVILFMVIALVICATFVEFHGNEFKAIVYEFMAIGSLHKWLHPYRVAEQEQQEHKKLKLIEKLDISIDIACALEYLHCGCGSTIIHGDLKPSNVRLDDEIMAHVGDFGLAKFISVASNDVSQSQSDSIGIWGTIGYAAPKYGVGDMASTLGDVYSFGILLLEMFIGKRPIDNMFKDHLNLHNFVKEALLDQVMEIVDPYILLKHNTSSWIRDCMFAIMRIRDGCSIESPRDQMETESVISELHKI
ncbi:receptor kinase-like protein Xa21 [Camellia sinensis]|uniref:receptor kinase-like protein Xa21 n=1 Tax=Camellia sinensis TaxID=4442 RepID=UPI001035B948|nr:receptor kinase-like protein Xa21 [Camellia sinensis]